jgi:hypothetical protein
MAARSQSQKLEPLAETMRRPWLQSAQRPTRERSTMPSGGPWLRVVTAASLKSGERGQREAEALEKLLDPAHHWLLFLFGTGRWAGVRAGTTSVAKAWQRFSPAPALHLAYASAPVSSAAPPEET